VAPISVVVAAVSVAVACCWRVVAAISVTEVVTCTEDRWAWDTRLFNSSAMLLKPVSMESNSSLRPRCRRAVRSPEASAWRFCTTRCTGSVMARTSKAPQTKAAATARSTETIMLSSALRAASTMLPVASSAVLRL